MKGFISIGLVAVCSISATFAASPETNYEQCNHIAGVTVPDNVSVGPAAIEFTTDVGKVSVDSERIRSGDKTWQGAFVKDYEIALRQFLSQAALMANVAKSIRQLSSFPNAAADMCSSILALQRASLTVEQSAKGFVSPVHVSLN